MKGLGRRFFFYFIGFSLGCVLVWSLLFKGREERASWMPEGRVIDFLNRTTIEITKGARCKMKCYDLSEGFMDEDFWKRANVNFGKSATNRKPCPEYLIESSLQNGERIIIYAEVCESKETAKIREIKIANRSTCSCN